MSLFPDDPLKQGEAEDLQPDPAETARQEAEQREQEAQEAEAVAMEKALKDGQNSDGDVTGADDTYISPKDLSFLNGE